MRRVLRLRVTEASSCFQRTALLAAKVHYTLDTDYWLFCVYGAGSNSYCSVSFD